MSKNETVNVACDICPSDVAEFTIEDGLVTWIEVPENTQSVRVPDHVEIRVKVNPVLRFPEHEGVRAAKLSAGPQDGGVYLKIGDHGVNSGRTLSKAQWATLKRHVDGAIFNKED